MLMDKRNQTVAYERAECVRTIEYMRCMMEDSLMADRFVQIEKSDKNFNESVDMKIKLAIAETEKKYMGKFIALLIGLIGEAVGLIISFIK